MKRSSLVALAVVLAAVGGFGGARLLSPAAAAAAAQPLDCAAVKGATMKVACAELNVVLRDMEREALHCTAGVLDAEGALEAISGNELYQRILKGEIPRETLQELIRQDRLDHVQRAVQTMSNVTKQAHETTMNVISNMKA